MQHTSYHGYIHLITFLKLLSVSTCQW